MVKQNKGKVSKSKWVFLLNVIAFGMGVDSYWSASSSAITAGMAIRQVRWFLGKQAFSPLTAGGPSGKSLKKTFQSILCLSVHIWQKPDEKHCWDRCIPWGIYIFRTHFLEQIVAWNSKKMGKGRCWIVIRLKLFLCLLFNQWMK